MHPSDSPFPCYWWGISLEKTGLGDVRPDMGTYGRYDYTPLPPLPIDLHGNFDWLLTAPEDKRNNIGTEKAAENARSLISLRHASKRISLPLPEAFMTFMAKPSLHRRVRSNTDCYLDLCPGLVRPPVGGGYLVRFLADSQGCLFWYLYLTPDGSAHAVVCSPDLYGIEAELWPGMEEPDPAEIVFVEESFERFLCRFWLENEIWFANWLKTPIPAVGQAYIGHYRCKG
ncbi:MAG: hypothetical protein ACLP9L_12590 [Thermoguttaceae bacterium]